MKKSILSLAAIMAMSSALMAGGDIAPVQVAEAGVEVPVVCAPEAEVKTDRGFYLGAAYGAATYDTDLEAGDLGNNNTYFNDVKYGSAMVQAGYKFNQYIAVEGRYWFGMEREAQDVLLDETFVLSNDTWGAYVKPMYPVTDKMDIYGLIGQTGSTFEATHPVYTVTDDSDLQGFSWGAGASYEVMNSVSVFVDYVNMYDDEYESKLVAGNVYYDKLDSWNFGATYSF